MITEIDYNFKPIKNNILFQDFAKEFNILFQDFALWKKTQLSNHSKITDLLAQEIYKKLIAPAKRARPMLTYYTSGLFNNTKNQTELIKLLFSLELFHTFALIHDDITDLAETRRGEPTIEKYIKDYYSEKITPQKASHIGLNSAMYAGDILLYQSTFLANNLDISVLIKQKIQKTFYTMQTEVFLGQCDEGLDLIYEPLKNITEDRVLQVLAYKSGRYSIQKPMLLGAILAGVDDKIITLIKELGELLGIVFQVKDDLLGLFGNESVIGKSITSDIQEGKKTLIMVKTYNLADDNGKKLIDSVLGNQNASEDEIKALKDLVISLGVKQELEMWCEDQVNNFIKGIKSIPNTNDFYRENIIQIAEYIVSRKY